MIQMLAPVGLIQDPTVTVEAIFTSTGFEESTTDEDAGIVLDSTSFYAEQGGQVNYLPLIFLVSYVVVSTIQVSNSENFENSLHLIALVETSPVEIQQSANEVIVIFFCRFMIQDFWKVQVARLK